MEKGRVWEEIGGCLNWRVVGGSCHGGCIYFGRRTKQDGSALFRGRETEVRHAVGIVRGQEVKDVLWVERRSDYGAPSDGWMKRCRGWLCRDSGTDVRRRKEGGTERLVMGMKESWSRRLILPHDLAERDQLPPQLTALPPPQIDKQ